MNKRHYFLGLLGVLVCSCGAGDVGSHAAAAPHSPSTQRPALVAKNETARAPLEYRAENDGDRVFIENAERAIGEYSEFIARAGEREEYASAVKRSREQIQDLRDAIIFVRAGSGQP
jgi:hypothetical protein